MSDKSCSTVCRICHEQGGLESPCACSGTVKFAHRDCIQRWCNEKGDTTCEICLQKFKHGYTSSGEEINSGETLETDHSEWASCCKSAALTFISLLLARHLFGALLLVRDLFDVITGGLGVYPFYLVMVIIARAVAIFLPLYKLIRILAVLDNGIREYQTAVGFPT